MNTAEIRNQLIALGTSILILEREIGLLAQRKFADGWDAALVDYALKQTSTEEPTFDSAGDIPNDYTRD